MSIICSEEKLENGKEYLKNSAIPPKEPLNDFKHHTVKGVIEPQKPRAVTSQSSALETDREGKEEDTTTTGRVKNQKNSEDLSRSPRSKIGDLWINCDNVRLQQSLF